MALKTCSVVGQDKNGKLIRLHIKAESRFEAAARGMDEIRERGGTISELSVTIPTQEWTVSPEQIYAWVSKRGNRDNIGMQAIKARLQAYLKPK